MAFVRLAYFPEGTAEHFRALARELEPAPRPAERLVFVAGPVDGGWQVMQVWVSKADLERFNARWLRPALERLGSDGPPGPSLVRDFDAAECWIGDSPLATLSGPPSGE